MDSPDMDIEDDDFDVDDEPKNVKFNKKGNLDDSKTVSIIYVKMYVIYIFFNLIRGRFYIIFVQLFWNLFSILLFCFSFTSTTDVCTPSISIAKFLNNININY